VGVGGVRRGVTHIGGDLLEALERDRLLASVSEFISNSEPRCVDSHTEFVSVAIVIC
jgi:hypothetical protein